MALISIMTACYNEEDNVEEIYRRVKDVFAALPQHQYEHIFIDNASQDNTVSLLKKIAAQDKNVKLIVNSRNFGHIRSPFFGLMQAKGDAVMSLVCDLQDPPELIPDFIRQWEQGHKIVIGVKQTVEENWFMKKIRRFYYHLITKIASEKQIKNYTGFGLYDKQVIDALRKFDDPYPYFRGMIAEIGFDVAEIPYHQPSRKKGFTKNNFFTLYDMAMLGVTSTHSISYHVWIFLRTAKFYDCSDLFNIKNNLLAEVFLWHGAYIDRIILFYRHTIIFSGCIRRIHCVYPYSCKKAAVGAS